MANLTKPTRDRISAPKFAFPKQRKEPLENASHVRNAVARFKQVKGVTEAERRAAWKRIQSAAKRYGVELEGVRLARTRHVARLPWQRERDCSTMGCLAAKSRVAGACKRADVPFFGTKF